MSKNNKNIFAIGLGLTIIIISNIIGHFMPTMSICATPVALTIIIGDINNRLYKSNFFLTALYGYGLLLFNDILVRFYAGGTHDSEGKGWIYMFSAIAFILSFIIMTYYSVRTIDKRGDISKTKSILTNFIFLLITTIATGLIYSHFLADL